MKASAWKTFEEIEPGLHWLKQIQPCVDPTMVRYYLSAHDSTPYIHFMESGNRFKASDLKMDVLRFVPVAPAPNSGFPGTGSGPGGAVTLCDEHYELGEQ